MINVTVWDSESKALIGDGTTVLWRSFASAETPDIVSIPRLVEDNADSLRASYLAWVYELGEVHVKHGRLVDHLQLRSGFSYWWMTLLVEKCNFAKSTRINDAIRFLAFKVWLHEKKINKIKVVSYNQQLVECLRLLSKELGIEFERASLPKQTEPISWYRPTCVLPPFIKAIVWLLNYLVRRWPLRGVGLEEWKKTKGDTTFISYLFNLVPEAQKSGKYESRYWAHLTDALQAKGIKTNWLHLYVPDNLLPSAKDASKTIQNFTKNGKGQQCHVTLDTFIGVAIIIRTLRDWLHLIWLGIRFEHSLSNAQRNGTVPNLWPLMRQEWRESMFGVSAVWNILSLNLFETALNHLPKQRNGLYLQENQGWEFGMVGAWQSANHGRLIGVPHSTVRFWDLRYYFDPRSYLRSSRNPLPLPNLVACNGPVMRGAFLKIGYSKTDLADVEALRYLYLSETKLKPILDCPKRKKSVRLLVLGDYLSENTRLQMKLLVRAIAYLPSDLAVVVKPHPNCPIDASDYPTLKMQVTTRPIGELLHECDVAFSSSTTSASVDAYCANVPIVSMLDTNSLNLSPLRGCLNVRFASNPEELANALIELSCSRDAQTARNEFFFIDDELPRWKELLLN